MLNFWAAFLLGTFGLSWLILEAVIPDRKCIDYIVWFPLIAGLIISTFYLIVLLTK